MACNTNYISWDCEGGGGGKMAELPHSARTAPLAPLVAHSTIGPVGRRIEPCLC